MSASACVCVRCHRELIRGGRVQFAVVWGDAPTGAIAWDFRTTPWPSIGLCGPCSLALADWLAVAPPPDPTSAAAQAKPARARAKHRRDGAAWVV
jgi:hypothetical protein